MKKMKKIAFAIIALFTFTFIGCKNDAKKEEDSSEEMV